MKGPTLGSYILALFAQRPGQWMTSRTIADHLADGTSSRSVAMACQRLEANGRLRRISIGSNNAIAWKVPA